MLNTSHVTFLISLPFLGCTAATPGARPHDMSTEEHEARAEEEDRQATAHARQYDSQADVERLRCRPGSSAARRDLVWSDICWTSVTNATNTHRRQAEEHRRHAANHRAASRALKEAEARTCAGIAPDDRDMSPFEHAEDIIGVGPLTIPEADARAKVPTERTVGAIVTFRALEGMTAEWLQRVVDCHLARNASLGHDVPEMPNCPLVPRGVEARVSSTSRSSARGRREVPSWP